jgi:NADP-dependent 3-hydroxy acid dehydrogenase YdfG
MIAVSSPLELHNRVVVVTGASAGVGRAIVHRFARAGAALGLIARDRAALAEVKAEVERFGGMAIVAPADVADADQVFAAAEQVGRALGRIDVWVNAAMVTMFSPLSRMTAEEFRRVTEVTYLGFVHGTMAALRNMQPRNQGTIIQIGSALAYRGIPLQSAYCGAKHAIRGFTDSLRAELIHDGSRIDVVVIDLPAVNTPQFDWARTHLTREPRPVGTVFQPEAIADIVLKAVLRPRREYWIGWSTLKVILGNIVLPGWLDRYLARVAVAGQERKAVVRPGRRDNLFEPVHELHRIQGSFGEEAKTSPIVAVGPAARLVAVILGGLLMCGIGFMTARLLRRDQELSADPGRR